VARFVEEFERYIPIFKSTLSTGDGDWAVKGFADVRGNIYPVGLDTKVISKLIEIMLDPDILRFAEEYGYDVIPCEYQNYYPDKTFIDKKTGEKLALDVKSTYRTSDTRVNGMTLGAYTGIGT
jgi:hypothetical protein